MFSKLQTLERENDKLTTLVRKFKNFLKFLWFKVKKDEKPGFLESLKKGIHKFTSNYQNQAQPQKILTSKQAIQNEKEKEKITKKKEDLELGSMQTYNFTKNNEVFFIMRNF